MKKIWLFILIYLVFPANSFAQNIGITRKNKPGNIPLDTTVGNIVTNVLLIMFIIGGLGALVFMVWGALDWILSGGDKEKLAGAGKKITNALLGLVLLALSFFIITLIGEIIGIEILNQKYLPTLYDDPAIKIPPFKDPNS